LNYSIEKVLSRRAKHADLLRKMQELEGDVGGWRALLLAHPAIARQAP